MRRWRVGADRSDRLVGHRIADRDIREAAQHEKAVTLP